MPFDPLGNVNAAAHVLPQPGGPCALVAETADVVGFGRFASDLTLLAYRGRA